MPNQWTGRKVMRMRRMIMIRDNNICAICGTYAPYHEGHVDHKIPRKLGGPVYNPANLQWTHARCNQRKGMKLQRGGTQLRS